MIFHLVTPAQAGVGLEKLQCFKRLILARFAHTI